MSQQYAFATNIHTVLSLIHAGGVYFRVHFAFYTMAVAQECEMKTDMYSLCNHNGHFESILSLNQNDKVGLFAVIGKSAEMKEHQCAECIIT